MIGIINYGSGNIYSIANIFKRLNIDHSIIEDPDLLLSCSKLILPGVGAFDETMKLIAGKGFTDILNELVMVEKKVILGVCVGMQIMGNNSEEGNEAGFGWIRGSIRKLDASLISDKPKLPHLGWNTLEMKENNILLEDIDPVKGFYFLHNYFFDVDDDNDITAFCQYGKKFACMVNHENVYGVQFHPEKSHHNGIQLFRNFANI